MAVLYQNMHYSEVFYNDVVLYPTIVAHLTLNFSHSTMKS